VCAVWEIYIYIYLLLLSFSFRTVGIIYVITLAAVAVIDYTACVTIYTTHSLLGITRSIGLDIYYVIDSLVGWRGGGVC
jgi:hypothetical protein